jgi:hypothetical protein
MGLDNPTIIDAMGFDVTSGDVILTILDSWDWDDEATHIQALKEKLKAYLGFIESGEILDIRPEAAAKELVIEIVGRFQLTDTAKRFLESVSPIAAEVETTIRFKHFP